MATTSDRRNADARSGGKIVRNRTRVPAASRTPYARPEKLPDRAPIDEQQNPNWLSGLIYPAKMIASGAGKLLSFFEPDYSSSSSSSSSSSNAYSSDNDEEEEEVGNDVSSLQDGRLDEVPSSSKSDKKRVIKQLVTLETFSREEGNELIKLIKSRVVDANGNSDESAAIMRTTAIMEARKWLQQKGSGSKRMMESELDVMNLATPSQVTRKEKGSPVDMAKSYMQNRPAWGSPTSNHSEFGSPSQFGILHFKEETPKSTLRSSEMKRSSLSSGSWNILEEIRRVRSKATEELLAATPLTKTHLSSFSPESNPPQYSMTDVEIEAHQDSTHDRAQNVPPDASTSIASIINQDGAAIQSMERQECQQDADLKSNEVNDLRTAAVNGFRSIVCSLAAGQDATRKPRPCKEENDNPVGSSQAGPNVHMEHHPDPNRPDIVVNGSQNSSSFQHEEVSEELSQPIEEQASTAKNEGPPRERKSRGGYTRRGRGRRGK